MENSKKSTWFLHQHWLCSPYSTWQSHFRSIWTSATNWKSWFWKPHSLWNCWWIFHTYGYATATDISKINDTIKTPYVTPMNQLKCFLNMSKMHKSLSSVQCLDTNYQILSYTCLITSPIQVFLRWNPWLVPPT